MDEKLFIGADGKPMPFYDAVVGGRSVGVPGTVRMLEQRRTGSTGKLAWAELFSPPSRWPRAASRSTRLNALFCQREVPWPGSAGRRLISTTPSGPGPLATC